MPPLPSLISGNVVEWVSMNVRLTPKSIRNYRTAVGGIKEKVLGAHRAGITKFVFLLFYFPLPLPILE